MTSKTCIHCLVIESKKHTCFPLNVVLSVSALRRPFTFESTAASSGPREGGEELPSSPAAKEKFAKASYFLKYLQNVVNEHCMQRSAM